MNVTDGAQVGPVLVPKESSVIFSVTNRGLLDEIHAADPIARFHLTVVNATLWQLPDLVTGSASFELENAATSGTIDLSSVTLDEKLSQNYWGLNVSVVITSTPTLAILITPELSGANHCFEVTASYNDNLKEVHLTGLTAMPEANNVCNSTLSASSNHAIAPSISPTAGQVLVPTGHARLHRAHSRGGQE